MCFVVPSQSLQGQIFPCPDQTECESGTSPSRWGGLEIGRPSADMEWMAQPPKVLQPPELLMVSHLFACAII